ncbi:DUF6588 family protein [Salegentibacter sp. F188]|uniref:DUF6588 family protein n=1 Tax=Autumnicola patrickiae TaxID=3075591 RepID=A0ABU3E0I1_9FLAO|nr:DUF6588 family protein [Salegentibacter sp. F188]MDT0689462.1 DUF6588 family protein [Salegentibacter sp. F188]
MKKIYYIFCLTAILCGTSVSAQSSTDIPVVNDLRRIAEGFAQPAANSIAYQANGGWFSSAQSLGAWKFEVSLHANALIVPESRKTFKISNLSALNIQGGGNSAIIPTAFGSSSEVYFEGEVLGQEIPPFQAIEGVNQSIVAHPFAQVTVGLPFETEVAVRAVPQLKVNDVEVSTYGVGIKHNFSQYLRFNRPDDFQFAAFAAYSIFDVAYAFEPVDLAEFAQLNAIDVDANVWVAEALGSKRYGNFEIFGALGVASSNFSYMMQGSNFGLSTINEALEDLGDSEAQFKGDIGFNVYFDDFKVSTMATAGRFFNLNVGLHFRI